MVMNLEYRPVIKSVPVSYNLKTALIKRLWPQENFTVPVLIDASWVGYFQGLKDAGFTEADLIIDALKTHERLQFDLS
jgi:hypothetical protein